MRSRIEEYHAWSNAAAARSGPASRRLSSSSSGPRPTACPVVYPDPLPLGQLLSSLGQGRAELLAGGLAAGDPQRARLPAERAPLTKAKVPAVVGRGRERIRPGAVHLGREGSQRLAY